MILAWTGEEYHVDKLVIDTQTYRRTHTQTQATTIPEAQN